MLELLKEDRRYAFDAYLFLFEALTYAQTVMGLGSEQPSEPEASGEEEDDDDDEAVPERHVTGQQLCEAIRAYAHEQFGYLAKQVLNSWGVNSTGDFGEMVYNLIRIGHMRKTPKDRREDFDDVFDFEVDLRQKYRIQIPS